MKPAPLHCSCAGAHFSTVFTYTAPPEGEIQFRFSTSGAYRREVLSCEVCGHFVSIHDMDEGTLYAGDYLDATYCDDDGLRRTFERIAGLEPSRSDNHGRVRRILEFASAHLARRSRPSVLDVGSGLCIFLHRMKAAGWDCTALDPDPRAVRHAMDVVGVRGVGGDFLVIEDLGRFDVIAFNKVLEHVHDPVAMLRRAHRCLARGGFVYVEVPDGEAAVTEGPEREEFFIEHWHVFSAASVALLASRAGFAVRALERLREPSAKFTLRAFLTPAAPPAEAT